MDQAARRRIGFGTSSRWRIRDSDRFLGSIGFTIEGSGTETVADAGYFFLREHQGHGYATEAMRELIRFALEDMGIPEVRAGCFADNRASERVMQKSGMVRDPSEDREAVLDRCVLKRVRYRIRKD